MQASLADVAVWSFVLIKPFDVIVLLGSSIMHLLKSKNYNVNTGSVQNEYFLRLFCRTQILEN